MDRFIQLEAFTRIAETGSLTEAARRLGLSRSRLSRVLQELEARLGVRLVNRTTRRLSLTEPGQRLLPRCQRLLADLVEAEEEAVVAGGRPRGLLRVSAPVSFGTLHLAPLVPDYLAAFPEVELDLVLDDRFVDLIDEGFDLAVRIGRLADSGLVARRLAPCRMQVCAAPAYLARHGAPTSPAELARHACLGYSYWAGGGAWELIGPDGPVLVRFRPRLRANSGEALAAAAAAGQGIVAEPTFILAPWLASGALVPILPGWRVRELAVHAVFPEGRLVSAKVRRFVELLAARLGPEPPWDRAAAGAG